MNVVSVCENIFLITNKLIRMYYLPLDLVLLSFVALAFIHIFYYLFKLSWPEMYFSVSDSASLFISFSPIRYFAFRVIPILVIISLIIGISGTSDIKLRIFAGLAIGLVHAYITNLNALKKLFTNDNTIHIYLNKTFQIFIHFVTVGIILVTSSLAGALSGWNKIKLITPSMGGLVDNLWSSVIAAMLGVWIYKLYQKKEVDSRDLFDKYLENISSKTLKTINDESKKQKANVNIVKAVCIVENIQRPAWIRKIEKIKSILSKRGTYGIMQIESDRYVSDKESVRIAVEKFFSNTELMKWPELSKIVYKYNNDERYNEFVEQAYRHLSQELYEYEDDQKG